MDALANFSITQCKILAAVLNQFAARYPMLKIVKIQGDQCIENYPDRLMPTLLIYGPNDFRTQMVGLAELGGNNTKVQGIIFIFVRTDLRFGEIRSEDWCVE